MSELWTYFFNSTPFIPHGHCYLWQTDLVWLHIISDGLIALAYYSIPATLFYFVRKRQDLPFYWIFLLFSGFIVACGTTHIMEVWTLWYPTYWVSGFLKAITAIISVFTALTLIPLVPKALLLPSSAQLERANKDLQNEIGERLKVEAELRKYQNHLEELVTIRTNEITNANEKLQQQINERQHIVEILRESEERYRYLAEAIPQLVWTADANGECDYFNQNWCDYTGLNLEESLGSGWLAALHLEDLERSYETWSKAVETGALYENEYRFKRAADGSYRWLLGRGLPLKDHQGRVVKWFGTCTDIHEQKQILEERARLLELEQTARAEAETANRIKDEFLAVLSHELRTPLNAILGWSKLLQERKLDPTRTFQALATIERNATLQVQLIEDLLDISRILQGKLVINITKVNLVTVILAALETMRLAAESKLIQVLTNFPPNIGQVMGDSARLQQVVWNLLSNAVKFTPNGGKIEVTLDKMEGYAQIVVSDTGKGIQPEFLPYVFDYFRQADSSSTRRFGGLGLGLAIVRKIVEIHGGTVTAQSLGEEQGASFTVRLPILPEEDGSVTYQQHRSASLVTNSLPLEGIKVLVVDDDADSRDFLAFILEQEGADVSLATSALEVLQLLPEIKPDVLVSDISMPDMDGYTLIRQMRTWTAEQGGAIPAIALTAFARQYDREQALQAGFQLHLPKPLNAEEFIAAVVELVKSQHSIVSFH
ncbi:ATP-binding protein [Anabaena sp. FACHB-709]|uniref:histidine kinase n=2 Tax=Nostocaceae TaxID=1162 RepID=A0A1Z4KQJ2_ANAVA|nr:MULTISPECIES: PAS domain-containing hybrid sensor histidine kinase/response regulator [Nostocaceae]BAY71153.1 two-component hybrid sensor and regulator [Trichormus variabilis NIES-23]HBW29353.1 hybrid sensor histidine kinase/response regulator [Nostoc sp. UBA8866]MBD2171948.1 response regulator [Anabaena cylindrica FACHB-318]MBD2263526.1 response regulator [Anabaena sp. FACHB-709]MBD2273070.1 response regulator [Nostoc sp. PCC 7120 = FACHB-418]